MDIFNDIFSTLNLQGALYFRTDFTPPWGVSVPQYEQAARFHLIIQGNCHVQVNGNSAVKLSAGDLIMIPRGIPHILAHDPYTNAPPLETVLKDAGYTGDGVLTVGKGKPQATTQMVCGHFNFRNHANHPLLQALPEYLLLANSCRAKHPLLDEILRMITRRIFAENLGAEASITRLSEIVFIELIKLGFDDHPHLQSVLDAFHDPKIGKSLQLIHSRPDHSWTVESLASEVAMSRSRFSNRFSQLLGIGPMAYLADWRLQKALSMLDGSRLSVQQIASQTGYQSPSAFTRAFSGKFGLAPTEYRHTAS